MEMLFTINPQPHHPTNDNTNVESFSSLPIPIQESDPHQEEIDVVSITNDVLPLSVDNGKVSNIHNIQSWGGSIGPDGFLPSILLLVVIVVAVVIVVVVILVVVVDSSIVKLSFVITGFEMVTLPSILRGNPSMKTFIIFQNLAPYSRTILLYQELFELRPSDLSSIQLLQENTDSFRSNQWMSPTPPSVPLKLKGWQLINYLLLHFLATGASLGSVFLLVLSAFATLAAYASKAVAKLSTTSFLMLA
nr:hypothetical protein [Tanacetum cinerariifolium]